MSLTVSNLSFSYGERQVLNNVCFKAEDNQLLSVLGPNGAGKSTMFRCILGLLKDYKGEVLIGDKEIKNLDARQIAKLIAYIPQAHYPSFNYSVFDMVLMGTSIHVSMVASPGRKQVKLVEEALERLGIEHLKNRGYTQISGGERQLVLIARAIVQESKILIMDEPTANLDFGNQIRVLSEVKSLANEGYTIIQSTHNPEQAFQFSDNVLAFKEGRVIASGSPSEIFTEDLIKKLYGIDTEMQSLYDGKIKVCIPKALL